MAPRAVVYGPNVMKEYFHRAEETAAVMTPDGGFRTGDMGYVDADGYLFITGRIKEQYKLENGKYVVPALLEDKLKLSPYIANVMVYGDNKPYNVALIAPNVAAVGDWGRGRGLHLSEGLDELAKDARVRDLFIQEMRALSAEWKGFERIADFAFVPDFTVDNGLLTPKMSLRRRRVIDAHGELLARLFAAKGRPAQRGAAPPA
jgi:long-chain acyl-CoA synthetase